MEEIEKNSWGGSQNLGEGVIGASKENFGPWVGDLGPGGVIRVQNGNMGTKSHAQPR